jgi:hypothetical protein
LATTTPTDDGAARLCFVTQSENGLVRVSANGAKLDDDVLHFSGDSSLTGGSYRVLWRNDLTIHAKLTKPTQRGLTAFQGESRARLG